MHYPRFPYLRQGDIVDIIAPASGCPIFELEDTINKSKEFIKSLGLKPRISCDIIVPGNDPFSANTIRYRTAELINALTNDISAAIWCIRGGYGSINLINHLNAISKPSREKLFIGFSDITALHIYLTQKWDWHTLHAKVLYQMLDSKIINEKEIEDIKDIIFAKKEYIKYQLEPLNKIAEEIIELNGSLTGGNMSIIQCSLGTDWQIDCQDKILLMEEVNERGYRIDRMFYHFEQAKIFDKISALLIGDIIDAPEMNGAKLCDKAVHRLIERIKKPVFRIKGVGHKDENKPLIFNKLNKILKEKNKHYLKVGI